MSITMITLNMYINDRYNAEEGEPAPTQEAEINIAAIRCFYARKRNEPGSRITFTDGGGFAVRETPETIKARLAGLPDPTAPLQLTQQ